MMRVGVIFYLLYIGLMFEWCYQGEDYEEAVDRYYGKCSNVGKSQIEAVSKELVKNLWQKIVQGAVVESSKEDESFQKKADA